MRRHPPILSIIAPAILLCPGCMFDRDKGIEESMGVEEKKANRVEQAEPAKPPKIGADTHLAAGQMLERQGDLLAAISQYERAIATEPRLAAAYSRLGIVYQKLGRVDDADEIFSKGLQSDPGSAMLRNNLGYSYLLQKKYNDAENEFRESLRIAPDFDRARMNLGIALGSQGLGAEAIEEFKQVVSEDIAYFNVAVLQTNLGDYPAARESLQTALSINPECNGARDQLQRVDALAASSAAPNNGAVMKPSASLAGSPTEEVVGDP